MASDLSTLVDTAVDALRAHDSRLFVESLRQLSTHETSELYADLFGLVAQLADTWSEDELPAKDALGDPGVAEVVRAIRAKNLEALLANAGTDVGEAVAKLLATAAALKQE